MSEQALQAVEAALDQKTLAQLMADAARWRWLKEQTGHFGDGSSTSVKLDPDDATREWFIRIGQRSLTGPSLEDIIDEAITQEANHQPFITTSQGMAGWFAVHLWWNDREKDIGGFWEPWDTGMGRYATKAEAEDEGRRWAETEGLEFRP